MWRFGLNLRSRHTQVSKIKRPVAELTDAHVDEPAYACFSRATAISCPSSTGRPNSAITSRPTCHSLGPGGEPLNEFKEVQFRLQPEIRFQDGAIADSTALTGASPGDTREVEAKLGTAVADPDLRGTSVTMRCQLIDLKCMRPPDLNQGFLDTINVDSVQSLREAVRATLERRISDRAAVRR